MQHFLNIFRIPAIILVILLLSCCKKDDSIIPKKHYAIILSEMYLADQYLEMNEKLRAKTDTLLLYEGIFNKYGFTYDDFRESTRYYLQDGDAMYKLHTKAKQLLIDAKDEVRRLIAIEEGKRIYWWALDSLGKHKVNDLWKVPYLRNVKWLSKSNEHIEWNFFKDTTEFDVPQNAIWWQNNVTLNIPGNKDTLYPILTKDYLIASERAKERVETKLRKEAEKKRKREMDKKTKKISPEKRIEAIATIEE